MSNFITTYTGMHLEPLNPDPDLIRIEDIAHALSLICRGNGHVKTFWSVGQHCICCAKEAWARGLSNRMALACLLHDASECYMSDIPRPFKQELSEYQMREDALLEMIYCKFLGSPLSDDERRQLKEIDDAMLWSDLENLLDEPQFGEIPEIYTDIDYTVRPFQNVEKEYLDLFYLYSGEEQPDPVYLEDIAAAFEGCMDEWSQFLNVRNGKIVTVPNEPGLTGMKEDEELWDEIEESDDYVRLPNQYELHEKRIMEDFTESCTRGNVASRLWRALNGRHSYRAFKDTIHETGMTQKYYDFRSLSFLRIAEDWCRENKVRYWRKT
ncbi:MAG: hypothetical protein K6C12_10135 [Oscillospiraceae bacterium]|nr:hypothetical protein [Oscillospiraceae bacterium]